MNITEGEYQTLLLKVSEITARNFQNTMRYVEARLGLSRTTTSSRDKVVHTAIRGALYTHGKNISSDIVSELNNLLR